MVKQNEPLSDAEYKAAEMFKIMVRNNKNFAIFMLSLEGKVTSWNSGAQLLTGYTSEDVLGESFKIFFTPEDCEDKAPEAEIYFAKSNGHFATEQQIITKSGTTLWCECILDSIRDKDGNLIGYCKIMRDLTENKRLENMKDEFISLVSHELRTPLTAITGTINILMRYSNQLPQKMKKMLHIAHENGLRLGKSISNILSIDSLESHTTKINFHKVDLSKLIKEVILENLDFANRFDIKLQYDQPPSKIIIYSHHKLLNEALAQVLHNAIKFSPPSSTVIAVCEVKDNHAEICICDEGDGVPAPFKKIIFQKFTQAQKTSIRQHGGLGLGLTISKQIIQRLGGELTFKNRKKRGTMFSLKFPIAPAAITEAFAKEHDLSDV